MLKPQFAKDTSFALVCAVHGWQFDPQCILYQRALQVALSVAACPPLWLKEDEPGGPIPQWQDLVPVAADVCHKLGWTISQHGSSIVRVDDYGITRTFLPGVDHCRAVQTFLFHLVHKCVCHVRDFGMPCIHHMFISLLADKL